MGKLERRCSETGLNLHGQLRLQCLFLNLSTCLESEFLKLDTKSLNSTVFNQHLLTRSKNIIYISFFFKLQPSAGTAKVYQKKTNCAIEAKEKNYERT